MRPFRFGIINETFSSPELVLDRACRAESLGYDTFLIRDHLASDYFGPQYAPLVTLSWLAALTSSIHLGTMVIDNDFRHPSMLAKEIATLDRLSGGRFELGIGAGWLDTDYRSTGIPYDDNSVRIDRLEESLKILHRLLRGESVSLKGPHYELADHQIFPEPIRPAGPPIMIGAGKPRMLRLAGRWADTVSLLSVSVSSGRLEDAIEPRRSAALAERIALVREGATGREEAVEYQLTADVTLAPTISRATEMAIAAHGWSGIDPIMVRDMPAVLLGPVEAIVEQIVRNRELLGVSYYVIADGSMEVFVPVVAALAGT